MAAESDPELDTGPLTKSEMCATFAEAFSRQGKGILEILSVSEHWDDLQEVISDREVETLKSSIRDWNGKRDEARAESVFRALQFKPHKATIMAKAAFLTANRCGVGITDLFSTPKHLWNVMVWCPIVAKSAASSRQPSRASSPARPPLDQGAASRHTSRASSPVRSSQAHAGPRSYAAVAAQSQHPLNTGTLGHQQTRSMPAWLEKLRSLQEPVELVDQAAPLNKQCAIRVSAWQRHQIKEMLGEWARTSTHPPSTIDDVEAYSAYTARLAEFRRRFPEERVRFVMALLIPHELPAALIPYGMPSDGLLKSLGVIRNIAVFRDVGNAPVAILEFDTAHSGAPHIEEVSAAKMGPGGWEGLAVVNPAHLPASMSGDEIRKLLRFPNSRRRAQLARASSLEWTHGMPVVDYQKPGFTFVFDHPRGDDDISHHTTTAVITRMLTSKLCRDFVVIAPGKIRVMRSATAAAMSVFHEALDTNLLRWALYVDEAKYLKYAMKKGARESRRIEVDEETPEEKPDQAALDAAWAIRIPQQAKEELEHIIEALSKRLQIPLQRFTGALPPNFVPKSKGTLTFALQSLPEAKKLVLYHELGWALFLGPVQSFREHDAQTQTYFDADREALKQLVEYHNAQIASGEARPTTETFQRIASRKKPQQTSSNRTPQKVGGNSHRRANSNRSRGTTAASIPATLGTWDSFHTPTSTYKQDGAARPPELSLEGATTTRTALTAPLLPNQQTPLNSGRTQGVPQRSAVAQGSATTTSTTTTNTSAQGGAPRRQ